MMTKLAWGVHGGGDKELNCRASARRIRRRTQEGRVEGTRGGDDRDPGCAAQVMANACVQTQRLRPLFMFPFVDLCLVSIVVCFACVFVFASCTSLMHICIFRRVLLSSCASVVKCV
jgi:hypothetical protein